MAQSLPFGIYLDVWEKRGTPKASILIGFSIINHPFWGTPIFGNTHFDLKAIALGSTSVRPQQRSWELARSKAAPAKNWQKAAPWARIPTWGDEPTVHMKGIVTNLAEL